MAVVLLMGCLACDGSAATATPCTRDPSDSSVRIFRAEKVDLLFVVDDSPSMAEEQSALRNELPELVSVLATGDLEFGRDEPGAGIQDFAPVEDLHVGVVSADMGSGGVAWPGCSAFGDDGVLQNRGAEDLLNCRGAYDRFLSFENPRGRTCHADPEACLDFAEDFACISALGTDGCGLEQPLEAMLKALMPGDPSCTEPFCTFFEGTRGHADDPTTNGGFLRPDSLLGVVILTDEDDCSAAERSAFESRPTGSDLGLACLDAEDALHPIERYVDGLRHLRHPGDLVFAVLGGAPVPLVRSSTDRETGEQDLSAMLADEAMIPRRNADETGLVPSCETDRGRALPPRRLVELASALQDDGAHATVQSVCQSDYRPAIDAILEQVARTLEGRCLPRPLRRDVDGLVGCELVEKLPPEGPTCEERRGRMPAGTETDDSGRVHPVCRIQQLPVADQEVADGMGWFYDDFSADTRFHCSPSRPRRVAFTPGARPPPDAIVRLRCLFPVYAEPPGHGAVEPMHRACDPYPSWRAWPPSCGSIAPEGFASPMICDPGERACAAPCDRDDDCGAGLFCDGARADRRDLGHLDIRPLNGGECPAPSCRADWDCPGTDLCVKGHCSAARGPRVTEWVRDDDEGICFRCVLPYRPVVEDGAPTCAIPCSADTDCQHPDVTGTVTSPDGGTRPVGPTCLPSGYCSLPRICVDPRCRP